MAQKAEKYLKVLEKSEKDALLVLTHHTTRFILLGWNSLLLFFQEFAYIIPFKAWFDILTNSRKSSTFSSIKLPVIIKQAYLLFWDLNVQLSLCWSRWDNFESDPKICKEDQNVHSLMFSVFLLKTSTWLWNLCPEVDMNIYSQHAVKKVLDLDERWEIPKI